MIPKSKLDLSAVSRAKSSATPPPSPASTMYARPDAHETVPESIKIRGQVFTGRDLHVEGRIDGLVLAEDRKVVVRSTGHVTANIHAKAVTVVGRVSGNIRASHRVDIRRGAKVTGDVVTPRITVADGCTFTGSVNRTPDTVIDVVKGRL